MSEDRLPQATPERPEFNYNVTTVDDPDYIEFETQEGRFGIHYPSESEAAPVRIGDAVLSRDAVIEGLHEEAIKEVSKRDFSRRYAQEEARAYQRSSEQSLAALSHAGQTQERTRVWPLAESIRTTNHLVSITPGLAQEVTLLGGGDAAVMKAIQERVADEVSYNPGEVLTPGRIRSIVGAPEDPDLLASWREDFYAPYSE